MTRTNNGRQNDFFKQFEELQEKFDFVCQKLDEVVEENKKLSAKVTKLENELTIERNKNKILEERNNLLLKDNKAKDKEIKRLNNKINKLTKELENNKISKKKDSSNSSKPSGTNGYKKTVTNNRKDSDKNPGGQEGHDLHKLDDDKINDMIKNGAILNVVNIDKSVENQNKEYKIKRKIDVQVITTITEYRYYPDKNGNYKIPNNVIQPNYFGDSVKSLATMLTNQFTNSMDAVTEILRVITNDTIAISKGTLSNWNKLLNKNLTPVLDHIEEELLSSHYLNCDESTIKINGKNSNVLVCCNSNYVRLWHSKFKKSIDIENIGFLPLYNGKIVKDGTDIYNDFGNGEFGSCGSHLTRYNRGISDFINHLGPKKMSAFLCETEKTRRNLISNGILAFSDNKLKEYEQMYNSILKEWIKEWQKSGLDSPLYDDERKLLSRYEEERDQILLYIYDFLIPFTNNNAESQLRPVKIRQKIGKARTENGMINYCNIRSCVNTYKKQGINVLEAFSCAFKNFPILP